MAKRLILGPILARLVQIWALIFFLFFWVGWGGGLPLPDVRHCRKLSLHAISRKAYNPNLEKKLILRIILARCAQSRATNFFFFKNLALPVTRYHGQLSSCTISEKTNDSILRKFSDGRTDGRTDRRVIS